MSIAKHIREIGRGKDGTRSLDREAARDLMTQVLEGQATDLEIGAFAIAMRIKGESLAELSGFVAAVHEHCLTVPSTRPTVVLPSYNGGRKLPNFTALLALLLAQEGVHVLVHGPRVAVGRVTTSAVFSALGLPFARDAEEVAHAWGRHEPVFIHTELLCPPLARLLAVRDVVGLRNSGHTVAKLLMPCTGSASLRVINYTHPEYAALLQQYLIDSRGDALLMRGTEGEPVADTRRPTPLDIYLGGVLQPESAPPLSEGQNTTLPWQMRIQDAAGTARCIQSMVSGETPIPLPLQGQVRRLVGALARLTGSDPATMTV